MELKITSAQPQYWYSNMIGYIVFATSKEYKFAGVIGYDVSFQGETRFIASKDCKPL